MSVYLVGGGRDLDLAPVVYEDFVTEAVTRSRRARPQPARIGVIVVAEAESLSDGVAWFETALTRCGPVSVQAATATEDPAGVLQGADGSPVPDSWFAGLDGLLVGGGLTPAYHRVLQPHATAIRLAVQEGLPYAGFSAGAAVAATRALLGGWRLGEVPVTHEDNAEDLDQLTVVDGLGLVPDTVEVHTAQWGTLSRLVAATDTGATTGGVAIDENTVVILASAPDTSAPAPMRVRGAGQAWLVTAAGGRTVVERRPAG